MTFEDARKDVKARPDAAIGRVLGGQYEIKRVIGRGGMGVVYEARHTFLGRRFAIKCLDPRLAEQPRSIKRFIREAQAAAALESPNIVAITDFGYAEEGLPFIVMEYLAGADLRVLLGDKQALPAKRAVDLALDCLRGLQVAHGAGLIHRDLKPENLFVTQGADGREHAKILDFGVAKLLEATTHTQEGTILGTLRYMAPEQISNAENVDHRVDLYAVGTILHELLAGEPAFKAEDPQRLMFDICYGEPPCLVGAHPGVDAGLAAVVERAISRDCGLRYQHASDFFDALKSFSSHPSTTIGTEPVHFGSGSGDATRASTAEPTSLAIVHEFLNRPTRHVALACVAVAAMAVAVAFLAMRSTGEAGAPRQMAPHVPAATGVRGHLGSAGSFSGNEPSAASSVPDTESTGIAPSVTGARLVSATRRRPDTRAPVAKVADPAPSASPGAQKPRGFVLENPYEP
jgi:serine/threonine protein kinase